MKKTSTALAVLLGTFIFAGTASASAIPTILLDQASNLDPAAYAPAGYNSLGVSYTASDWPLIAAAGGQNATVGNNSSNWGTAAIFGFYNADSTAISALQADITSNGGPVIYGFNLYAPASLGGQQVGFLVEEFLTAQNSAILTLTEMATTSLSGYVPTLADSGVTNFFSSGNITVTGYVQDTGTLYGLDAQIRANAYATPLPAAVFFVAPALAGLFGFSRRKRSEA